MGQPQRQGRGQTFAAGLLGVLPDGPHDRLNERVARGRPGMRPTGGDGRGGPQEAAGILAFVAVVLAEVIEQPGFAGAIAPGVAGLEFGEQFDFEGLTHVHRAGLSGVFYP